MRSRPSRLQVRVVEVLVPVVVAQVPVVVLVLVLVLALQVLVLVLQVQVLVPVVVVLLVLLLVLVLVLLLVLVLVASASAVWLPVLPVLPRSGLQRRAAPPARRPLVPPEPLAPSNTSFRFKSPVAGAFFIAPVQRASLMLRGQPFDGFHIP